MGPWVIRPAVVRSFAALRDDDASHQGEAAATADGKPPFKLSLNDFLLAALGQASLLNFFQQEQSLLPHGFGGLH